MGRRRYIHRRAAPAYGGLVGEGAAPKGCILIHSYFVSKSQFFTWRQQATPFNLILSPIVAKTLDWGRVVQTGEGGTGRYWVRHRNGRQFRATVNEVNLVGDAAARGRFRCGRLGRRSQFGAANGNNSIIRDFRFYLGAIALIVRCHQGGGIGD